jgi:hypothetical protein
MKKIGINIKTISNQKKSEQKYLNEEPEMLKLLKGLICLKVSIHE